MQPLQNPPLCSSTLQCYIQPKKRTSVVLIQNLIPMSFVYFSIHILYAQSHNAHTYNRQQILSYSDNHKELTRSYSNNCVTFRLALMAPFYGAIRLNFFFQFQRNLTKYQQIYIQTNSCQKILLKIKKVRKTKTFPFGFKLCHTAVRIWKSDVETVVRYSKWNTHIIYDIHTFYGISELLQEVTTFAPNP